MIDQNLMTFNFCRAMKAHITWIENFRFLPTADMAEETAVTLRLKRLKNKNKNIDPFAPLDQNGAKRTTSVFTVLIANMVLKKEAPPGKKR